MKYSIVEYFNGWLADADRSSNAGPASAQRSQFVSSHANLKILNNLLDMSTRSRASNGRFSATNATTDPTGGGGEETQEPDLSANTEPEPLADPGAGPDSGDLAGQGGDGAGTDSEPSTESSQEGSGSDDEVERHDKDQTDPAQAYRKAASRRRP